MAEHLGCKKPYGIQWLLGPARWDADGLRDELIRYASQHVVTPEAPGMLIVDKTGFLKKGEKSAGVQLQYSGSAGRIKNGQVSVFLALATARGRALIKVRCTCRRRGVRRRHYFHDKANRLTTWAGHTQVYDAAGNVITALSASGALSYKYAYDHHHHAVLLRWRERDCR